MNFGSSDDGDRITGTFGTVSSLNLMKVVFSFEEIDESLPYIPLAARRVLDIVGRRLNLDGWLSLNLADRKVLLLAGISEHIDADVVNAVLSRAHPKATVMTPPPEPPVLIPEKHLVDALGMDRPLDPERWSSLRSLDRYALARMVDKPDKLARAYDEIVGPRLGSLTHLNATGEAHMVDVGSKNATARRAVATGRVKISRAILDKVMRGATPKGDLFAVARVAGIQAAKRTPDLIPLCHSVALTKVEVSFSVDPASATIQVRAAAEALNRTGVEMEAMVAASVASLTLYDMIKSADRWAQIECVRLEEKSGGKSGDVRRPLESIPPR